MDRSSLHRSCSQAAAAGLIATGVLGLLLPKTLARLFGLAARRRKSLAFVRATSIRDVALGTVMLAAVLNERVDVLAVADASALIVSLTDLANAYYSGGRRLRLQHAAHAGGALLFAALLIDLPNRR